MIGERNELKLFRENLFFNLKKNKIKIKLLVNWLLNQLIKFI